ncbi:MAG TPA: hypothetical protein VFY87_03805 [Geminicoccaceae bacterium]|nr:hypothetical protein [Geminicoccaceae bacterium]
MRAARVEEATRRQPGQLGPADGPVAGVVGGDPSQERLSGLVD